MLYSLATGIAIKTDVIENGIKIGNGRSGSEVSGDCFFFKCSASIESGVSMS